MYRTDLVKLIDEGKARFSRTGQRGDTLRAHGLDAAEVQSIVDAVAAKITVKPKGGFVVVQESDDMPPHLGDADEMDGVQGAYDDETDTVYLVADNLDSAEIAAFVLAHELLERQPSRLALCGVWRG